MNTQKAKEIQLHKRLVKEYRTRYDQDYSRIYNAFWNSEILKGLPKEKSLSVLDCGCGNGVLLSSLVQTFEKVIGLDLSIDLAAEVDLKNKNLKGIVIGDAENLPFSDAAFDIVICRGSLHHLPSPSTAVRQIYKKLKKGGFFVLSEPCDDSLILRLPRKIFFREKPSRFTSVHKAFSSKEIKGMLSDSGFTIDNIRNFGLIAFPLCGLSDILPIMRFLIFRRALTKALIFFDEIFSRVALIKSQCWHIMIKSQK